MELKKLSEIKQHPLSIYINAQGEPLLYAPIDKLIQLIKQIPKVKRIILITNGTPLTKSLIARLASSGLNNLNISIHSLKQEKASYLAGRTINPKNILDLAQEAAKLGITITITPVVIFGQNEQDVRELAKECKKRSFKISPQNYLRYKQGSKKFKQKDFKYFFSYIAELKKEIGKKPFNLELDMVPDNALPCNIRKNETIKLQIILPGLLPNESIGIYKDRLVSVIGAGERRQVKAKVIRTKHNIIKAIAKH